MGNARAALNQETLGVPVAAIGVPTVVDAATLAADVLAEAARHGVTCVLGGARTRAAAEAHGWQMQELL